MSKIAFIGAGNMNSAVVTGLVTNGYTPQDIIVTNPSPEKRERLADKFQIKHTASNVEAAEIADYIVLGVKPYLVADVLKEIAANVDISGKCFLSVAAGCSIDTMEQALGKAAPVVRTMPNTPAQLGLGVTGLFASPLVSEEQKAKAEEMMSAVGIVKWLEKECDINSITALSGSGPAYFFLFMEAMEKQAKVLGFDDESARQIVQQTALGAAEMVVHNPVSIGQLRENVTSKGGTTQAALNHFDQGGLTQLVSGSINAALARAEEMAKDNS